MQFVNVIISTGAVTILAGAYPTATTGYVDGIGTNARFYNPWNLNISPDGMYALVADSGNNAIRKIIISTATVSILAGSYPMSSGYVDGIGTNAKFQLSHRTLLFRQMVLMLSQLKVQIISFEKL